MKEEVEKLLGGYATDTLNEGERQRLYAAALEDQEVFDALMAEQPLRDLFSDAAARRELLGALTDAGAARPARAQRIVRWFGTPSHFAAAAGLAAVAVGTAILLLHTDRTSIGPSPDLPVSSPTPFTGSASPPWFDPFRSPIPKADLNRRLFALPIQAVAPASMSLDRPGDRPKYAVGDSWRVSFEVGRQASVLILELDATGSVERLFHNESAQFPRVRAGQRQSVPPPWQPVRLLAPPAGERVLRLFTFPPNVDPASLMPDELRTVQEQVSVVEKRYVVGQ